MKHCSFFSWGFDVPWTTWQHYMKFEGKGVKTSASAWIDCHLRYWLAGWPSSYMTSKTSILETVACCILLLDTRLTAPLLHFLPGGACYAFAGDTLLSFLSQFKVFALQHAWLFLIPSMVCFPHNSLVASEILACQSFKTLYFSLFFHRLLPNLQISWFFPPFLTPSPIA